jgi:nucleoside-diphosphate-sugar epimerase
MIIGNGLLAKSINTYFNTINLDHDNHLIFASGVSNSKETQNTEFEREQTLLNNMILEYPTKTIVYFSSCALVHKNYLNIPYYNHKHNMEILVKKANNFIILRLPQVIGDSNNKDTIINFFINKIKNNEKLNIKKDAYRYFVDIDDVSIFLRFLIENEIKNTMLDFGNLHRYSVLEVVDIIARALNMQFYNQYILIEGNDAYRIDFTSMLDLLEKYQLKFDFSKEYLEEKIKKSYGENLNESI